jgi:hypothetical protein
MSLQRSSHYNRVQNAAKTDKIVVLRFMNVSASIDMFADQKAGV